MAVIFYGYFWTSKTCWYYLLFFFLLSCKLWWVKSYFLKPQVRKKEASYHCDHYTVIFGQKVDDSGLTHVIDETGVPVVKPLRADHIHFPKTRSKPRTSQCSGDKQVFKTPTLPGAKCLIEFEKQCQVSFQLWWFGVTSLVQQHSFSLSLKCINSVYFSS